MKIRKTMAIVLSALLLLGLLAGCGAKASNDRAPMEDLYISTESNGGIFDMADGKEEVEMSSSSDAALTDRKLIKTVELTTETEDLDQLLGIITARVAELGGYIENRDVYSGSSYSSYRQSRYATLTIRIPAEKLEIFVNHVEGASNVTSTNEATEDVTLNYIATESRMKALQAEEARLLALIDEAANLTELLQLESRLTEVRTELERVTSQLKLYDNLVDYGTVKLTVNEVQQYTPKEAPTFWERISSGFTGSLNNLGIILTELLIFFICALPYLVPMAVIAVVILAIIKKSNKKKKTGANPPFPKQDPPST